MTDAAAAGEPETATPPDLEAGQLVTVFYLSAAELQWYTTRSPGSVGTHGSHLTTLYRLRRVQRVRRRRDDVGSPAYRPDGGHQVHEAVQLNWIADA